MANTIRRVVDQFGNSVKLCCNNHHLFFSQDNEFIRLDENEDHGFSVDGSIYYQIATSISGTKK